MRYRNRFASFSDGPRAALSAAIIVLVLALPASAQNSAPTTDVIEPLSLQPTVVQDSVPDAGTFVGLPPPSTLIGPLHLLPNGDIEVLRKSTQPPTSHANAHAPAPLKPPVPQESGVSHIHNPPDAAEVVPTFTSNINNAPAWRPNHPYTAGQEVNTNGGAGLAGTRGYKALTSGISCPFGGPTGTGGNIVDCGVAWKYLSDIDYTSISLWLQNGIPLVSIAQPWARNRQYALYDTITTISSAPGQLYVAVSPGTSCSSGAGPSGKKSAISDCGVTWNWLATFRPPATLQNAEVNNLKGDYVGLVWNGGEYLNDGSRLNGFPYYPGYGRNSINMYYHYQAPTGGGEGTLAFNDPYTFKYSVTLTAAPGESIFDDSSHPLVYDPTKGVAIRCTGLASPYACFNAGDRGAKISRIQIKSNVQGIQASGNNNWIDKVLVDADGDGIWTDNGSTISNSVIYAGTVGLSAKYRTLIINDTVLGKSSAAMGVHQFYHPSFTGPPVLVNTVIMGFTYGCAYNPNGVLPDTPGFETQLPPSDDNATDVDSGGKQNGTEFTWTQDGYVSPPAVSMPCPGSHSLFNVPFTTANFANVTGGSYDAKLAPGSVLIGAGEALPSYRVTGNTTATGYTSDIWSLLTYPTNAGCAYESPRQRCLLIGQGISGPGMPNNTIVGAFESPDLGLGPGPQPYAISNSCDNSIGTGCGSSKINTANFVPIQSSDIFGTSRTTRYDIGAFQQQRSGRAGGRVLLR